MQALLLPTKLYPPPAPGRLVRRERLVNALLRAAPRPLTLVSAPAGFGKSTLLAEWTAEGQRAGLFRSGWLSLDAGDNSPQRFWAYFTAAWQSALQGSEPPPALLDQLHTLLQMDEARIASSMVPLLVNLILSVPQPVVIVLDDYHQIKNMDIHSGLAQLIERLPAHARLAAAARFDPPLPIPRLRVREQVTEIRAADLRFNGTEIAALFEHVPGVASSTADIEAIAASTEGWAAGLKMALLALQSQERTPEETRRFLESFTGRNIYVLDYLTEEVLSHLPAETQSFLVKTSLLDRLNDALCAAVAFGSTDFTAAARSILEQLEHANLFLIPLDQERRWFRYHHLFADLLRVRLQQSGEPEAELHRRAAAWYEAAGLIDEAMQHSTAGQDWENAARMVEKHGNAFLDQGQLATVLRWVEALPPGLLRRRPNLCAQMAWALAHAGKTHLVGPLLSEADAALAAWEQQKQGLLEPGSAEAPLDFTEKDAVRVRATLAILRAYGLIIAGRPEQALALAEQTLAQPDLEPRELAWLNWVVGYASRGLGDIERATRSYMKAVEIGRAGGTVWEDHSTDLGIAYWLTGRLENAAGVFEESLRAGAESGLRNKGNLSRVEAYLSAVRMEQDRVEEGLAHARKAVDYLQWWPSHNHIATAHGFSALALLATGSVDAARGEVELADQESRKGQVTPFVTRLVEQAWVRLWIAQGDRSSLETWASAQEIPLPQVAPIPDDSSARALNEYEEIRLVSLARAWIALGKRDAALLQKAVQLLTRLAASAEASGRVHAGIEIRVLAALSCWGLSQQGRGSSLDALDWLASSLAQGLSRGYRRVYLAEGAPMRDLLHALLSREHGWIEAKGIDQGEVLALLARFRQEEAAGQPAGLAEPLTEREQDVLRLLALGLSNREMAEKLFVSEGTIKTHVHNLIGKLGAQNRTQVLARARELKIPF